MRWLVTLDLPHETQPHAHIDVGNPAQAAAVVRAVREATRSNIRFSIEAYQGQWRCEDCPAWRLEPASSNLVSQLDDWTLPVWADDVLPLDS